MELHFLIGLVVVGACCGIGSALLAGLTFRRLKKVQAKYEAACEETFQDPLTHLFNRKGFLMVGKQQAHLAQRSGLSTVLYYLDLDGLKKINDTYGHHMGSQAIVDFATVLMATFRSSDVMARLGGDEFAVLASHPKTEMIDTVLNRLQAKMEEHNQKAERPYALAASCGETIYVPTQTLSDALIDADAKMYEVKRRRKRRQILTGKP